MSEENKSKKILLAEDEFFLARTFNVLFKKEGYEITIVNDGEQALQELEKGGCAVLLLDLIMPKMNGFEVLENLQEKGNTIPVIVVSNLGQEEDFERAKTLGVKEFFIKSNTPMKDVIQVVKKVLSE